MQVTRRGILLGAGAAGGLILAWTLTPRHFAPPLTAGEGEVAFDAWLKIGKDGVITVAVPEAELGQGITTLIPQIVAMELGADWRQVAVEPAPLSGAYGNVPLAARWASLWMPVMTSLADGSDTLLARRFAQREAFTVTADGTSLQAYEEPARIAAASARAMLAMAAADRWDVNWEECDAQGGFIVHDKRKLAFAELVDAAASFTPPSPAVARVQPPAERPGEFPAGAPLNYPRLDLPSKVDGSYTFAADIRLPDMVYAAIRHAPAGREGRLARFDASLARGVNGLIKLVPGPGWLAAVASDWWAAERALSLIAPGFAAKAKPGSDRIEASLGEALRYGTGETIASEGDPGKWLSGPFEHVGHYRIAPAHHAALETATATARFTNGKLELWLASQAPAAARKAAAAALDISAEQVVVYPMPAGGSFDARLESRQAAEAALIARDLGRPVQLIWSRWQEQLALPPRSPARAVLAARTAPDGSLIALKVRLAMPATTREFGRRLLDGESLSDALDAQDEADPLALEGMIPPYAIPHLIVEHVPAAIGLPTARQRGNSAAMGAFLIETFIDELAARAAREPLSYRMALLGHDVKLAACLQRVSALAEWGGGAGGTGQGVAVHQMRVAGREGRIAVIASARRDERGVRADKLTAVVDIGRIINVDIARQQIEGGMLFALGLANGSASSWDKGLPSISRLGLLGLPLLSDCPEIEVEFVESEADPFDPGELGVAGALPAIANALFSAGGTRVRSLPFMAGAA